MSWEWRARGLSASAPCVYSLARAMVNVHSVQTAGAVSFLWLTPFYAGHWWGPYTPTPYAMHSTQSSFISVQIHETPPHAWHSRHDYHSSNGNRQVSWHDEKWMKLAQQECPMGDVGTSGAETSGSATTVLGGNGTWFIERPGFSENHITCRTKWGQVR
jgi:hypothetical protein